MPHRAVYWPRGRALLVADLHLGKAQTFRASGVPIPGGTTGEQLGRLTRAIEASGAERLLVLGDLLHAPAGLTESILEPVAQWRTVNPISIEVITGNHDRRIESVAAAWSLTIRGDCTREGPFTLAHDPACEPEPGTFLWAGHLHPAVRLANSTQSIKLPCFHIMPRCGVLPAFSAFTGGASVRRVAGDRVFAVCEDRVIPMS